MVSRSGAWVTVTMIEVTIKILTHLQACASFVYNYIQTLFHCDTIILSFSLSQQVSAIHHKYSKNCDLLDRVLLARLKFR